MRILFGVRILVGLVLAFDVTLIGGLRHTFNFLTNLLARDRVLVRLLLKACILCVLALTFLNLFDCATSNAWLQSETLGTVLPLR